MKVNVWLPSSHVPVASVQNPDEWKKLFALRDDLMDPEDRGLLRKLIKYVEQLEQKMRARKL